MIGLPKVEARQVGCICSVGDKSQQWKGLFDRRVLRSDW